MYSHAYDFTILFEVVNISISLFFVEKLIYYQRLRVAQSNSLNGLISNLFMKSKNYHCDQCVRNFGRKANALRHNRSIHANSAVIINNNLKASNFSYKSHNRFYDYKTKFDLLEKVEVEITDDKFCVNFSDYFSAHPDDIKIIKIIDHLIKPLEELDELLYSINEKTRARLIWGNFCACLHSHNPVKPLNETVELYRSVRAVNKIANYIPETEIQNSEPIVILKSKIKNSHIYRRQNN